MSAHAPLAPSSAPIWGQCPGSRVLNVGDRSTSAAQEGTTAHEVAAKLLTSGRAPYAPDYAVSEEMFDAAALFYRAVRYVAGKGLLDKLRVEQPVQAPRIHPTDVYGTLDAGLWDVESRTLYIWDFKYGRRRVDAFENNQLIIYAAGLLHHENVSNIDDVNIVLTIVQPRCYQRPEAIDEWRLTGGELRGYINKLEAAAHDGVTINTGDHCRYCTGKLRCSVFQKSVKLAVELSGILTGSPSELSNTELSEQLQILEASYNKLSMFKDALTDEATARIERGENVDNYRLEETLSNNTWTAPKDQVAAIGTMLGVELTESKLISPTQAKKRLKIAGVDQSAISSVYGRKPTGNRLVFDDCKLSESKFK